MYWLGKDTLRVSAALFAENRRRLSKALKAADGVQPKTLVLLQGGEQQQRNCTDTDLLFRQVGDTRRPYSHLTVPLPRCHVSHYMQYAVTF